MTTDRETPDAPASGTPKMSVIEGGKSKTRQRAKGVRGATDRATSLTDAQEAFCQNVMSGLNYTAAYKAAYPNTTATDASIWSIACRLAAEVKVISRLEALRAQKEAEKRMQALSLAQFVLDGWKELAQSKIVHHERDEKGKPITRVEEIPPAVRTRNLELIGRHLGMFVERVETKDVTDKTADDIEAQIKARLGLA
jgi:hypothetical protein